MLLLTLIVAGLITTAYAQKDPVGGFCRRFGHQTTVIDRKLYIDGGFINYSPMEIDATNYTSKLSRWFYLVWRIPESPCIYLNI